LALIRHIAAIALGAALVAVPVSAQTQDPAPAPVDPSESGGVDVVPLRLGPLIVSGSAWLEASSTAGDDRNETIDMIRVRRARLGIAGNLTPRIGWNLTGELTSQPALRNAFVVVRFAEQLNVRVGQAAPPSGLERGMSPLAIELIDRSPLTTQLTYPLDTGVTVMNAEPYRQWVSYAFTIFNGTGSNRADNNDAKDMVGRLTVTPPRVAGLSINMTAGRGREPQGIRQLAGLGVEYDVPAVKLMIEGLRRPFGDLPTSDGVVGIVVYRIRPATATPHFRLLELAGRYMVFHDPASASGAAPPVFDEDAPPGDPVATLVPATTRELQVGANYHVNSNIRAMVNAVVPFDDRAAPDFTLLARLQLVF
jgi:hypothetical protein